MNLMGVDDGGGETLCYTYNGNAWLRFTINSKRIYIYIIELLRVFICDTRPSIPVVSVNIILIVFY